MIQPDSITEGAAYCSDGVWVRVMKLTDEYVWYFPLTEPRLTYAVPLEIFAANVAIKPPTEDNPPPERHHALSVFWRDAMPPDSFQCAKMIFMIRKFVENLRGYAVQESLEWDLKTDKP